jgi:predicted Zn-dependent protease
VDRLTHAVAADKDPWHVYLFRAPDVKNAAATRGNHVFIWSGMLDVTQNDAELAAVLAHEIAHVLAGHTEPDPNEEARKMLIQLGAVAAGIAVASATNDPTIANNLGDLAAQLTQGVASEVLVFPYSREMEFEADHIGLLVMAAGKYDPNASINFWDRLQSDPDIGSGMKYFSTHPPAGERLSKLRSALPLAFQIYKGEKPIPNIAQSVQKPKNTDSAKEAAKMNFQDQKTASSNPSAQKSPKSGQTYTIVKQGTVLYRAPSLRSVKLGEFEDGAKIEVTDVVGSWLEVESPDHGYIKKEHAQAP